MRKIMRSIHNWHKRQSSDIIKAPIFLLVFFTYLMICCKDDDDKLQTTTHVLLVYLASDNSLSTEGQAKLEAIAGSINYNPAHRILVYLDSRGSTPSLMEITKNNKIKVLEEYTTENSADPSVFSRVILRAKELHPEASFNLLVFSHASGWLPKGTLASPKSGSLLKSIITDTKDEMELADFASAIPDNSFDCIIFEACFMAGIEVAYQLRNKTNYILASSAEILSPGFTPIYQDIIPLQFKGLAGLEDFADKAFTHWDSQVGDDRSATFSIIETKHLETLANYISDNCDLTHQIDISESQYFDRYSYHLFFDFQEYYSQLTSVDKREKLNSLINATILWKASTPSFLRNSSGFDIHSHSGMTVYIEQQKFPLLNSSYKKLDWYKAITIGVA